MKKLIFLAAVLYLFLAPITYHPDNKLVLYWAGLDHGTVWNIWNYGMQHPESGGSHFNYPPVHFYLDKLQFFCAQAIGGVGFYDWLRTVPENDGYVAQIARYSLATKFILILFGLLVGYLVYLVAKQHQATETQAKMAAALWLFNPVVIYSIPVMGQNDVMAIMFFLIGWLLLLKSKLGASIIFGLAISIKMYPLIWLLYLLASERKFSVKQKLYVFFGSVVTYVLTLLPFIANPEFQKYVLNSDINDRFLISQIDLGFSDAISIVPLLLLLALFAIISKPMLLTTRNLLQSLGWQSFAVMTSCLVLLGFSHFHPQWLTWVVPFWSLWMITLDRQKALIAGSLSLSVIGVWLIIILLFSDSYLSFGLLVPLNQTLGNIPILRDLLQVKGINVYKYNMFAHTWLAWIGTISLIVLFKNSWISVNNNQLYFKKFPFSWRLSKFVTYLAAIVLSFICICTLSTATFLIPAPRSSLSPEGVEYDPLTDSISGSVAALYNNFSRIDLWFNHEKLINQDTYTLTLTNPQNTVIIEQDFSGFNVGSPGSVRFDFPPQANSADQTYLITINPKVIQSTSSAETLQLGYTDTDHQTIASKTFYSPPGGLSAAIKESIASLTRIVKQVPWLYALLLILLFFAL